MKLKPCQQDQQSKTSKAQGEDAPLVPNAQSSKQSGHKWKEHIHAFILAYADAIKMPHCLGK